MLLGMNLQLSKRGAKFSTVSLKYAGGLGMQSPEAIEFCERSDSYLRVCIYIY